MTTENHPIDQLFKERLGNFEQIPPVGLLDKINQEIAFRGRVRRINQLKTVTSIAAALVLIAMAGWYTFDLNQVTKNEFSQQIQIENSTTRPITGNGTLVPKTIENQLPVNQQKSGNTSSIQQIAKLRLLPILKIKHPNPPLQSERMPLLFSLPGSCRMHLFKPPRDHLKNL